MVKSKRDKAPKDTRKPKNSNDANRANKQSKNGLRDASTVRMAYAVDQWHVHMEAGKYWVFMTCYAATPAASRAASLCTLAVPAGEAPGDVQQQGEARQEGAHHLAGAGSGSSGGGARAMHLPLRFHCSSQTRTCEARVGRLGAAPGLPLTARCRLPAAYPARRTSSPRSCPPRASSPTAAGLATRG